MAYKKKTKKRQIKRNLELTVAHVKSGFNNTVVSITTTDGDVILRSSSGQFGFKGSRKATPFAATQIANKLAKDLLAMGGRSIEVNLQGPGSGRDAIVRGFQASGLNITVLRDVTPLPHNGCRQPKKPRN